MDSIVVDLPSSYNTILGRYILYELNADTLIYYYRMNFCIPNGIGVVRKNQAKARPVTLIYLGSYPYVKGGIESLT